MADRNVNINISYNVKSSGIDAVAANVNKAQVASDRLTESARKFSSQSQSGNRAAAQTIEGMRIQMARLKAQIELTNRSDTTRLKSLTAQYKTLKRQVDEFNRSLNNTGSATRSLNSRFGSLLNTVKAVFTVELVRRVATLSLDMAELAGNVAGVEHAFRTAFPQAELLINDLRSATRGTVTDLQLMQQTLQARNLGLPVENLAELFEFAAIRAQQTGESVDFLTRSIVTGLGRKSTLVIDNLGISALRLKEELGGVSVQAATAGEVTAAVARIASQEVQKMGGFIENSATTVKSLRVEFEELKEAIAEATLEGNEGFAGFLREATIALREFIKARGSLQQLNKNLLDNEIQRQALEDVGRIRSKAASDEFANDQQKKIDFIQQEINSRVQVIGQYNDAIKKLRSTVDRGRGFGFPGFSKENQEGAKRYNELVEQYGIRAKRVFDEEIEQARKQLNARIVNRQVIEETIRLLIIYRNTLTKGNEETEEAAGVIKILQDQIKALNEEILNAPAIDYDNGRVLELTKDLEITERALERVRAMISTLPPTVDITQTTQAVENRTFNVRPGFTEPNEFSKNVVGVFEQGTDAAERMTEAVNELIDALRTVNNVSQGTRPLDFVDMLEKEIENAKEVLVDTGFQVISEQIIDVAQANVEGLRVQLDELRAFYSEQQILAGDNKRAQDQLRIQEKREVRAAQIEIARKQKEADRFSIIVDTATGIIKAFATLPTPAAIVQSAIIAALGASSLAIVNRTPIPRFAKGKIGVDGPGHGTSDSIHAMISKGESIINSDATKKSYHLLNAINARKIDDRVINELRLTNNGVTHVPAFDDTRLIKAITSKKEVDFERIGTTLYKYQTVRNGYRRKVRSKIMGK